MEEELGLVPGETRIIHQDFVGNYLDIRYGDGAASWIDDRFELHDPHPRRRLHSPCSTVGPGGRRSSIAMDAQAILWPARRPADRAGRRAVGGWVRRSGTTTTGSCSATPITRPVATGAHEDNSSRSWGTLADGRPVDHDARISNRPPRRPRKTWSASVAPPLTAGTRGCGPWREWAGPATATTRPTTPDWWTGSTVSPHSRRPFSRSAGE